MAADRTRSIPGSLFFLGKVAISLGLLGLLFWQADRAAFLRTIATLSPLVYLGCALLYLLGYLISVVRWQRLLAAESIRLPFGRLCLVYFEGAFFNLFLPTLIGGDIVRGFAIYKITGGHPASLASILLDRLSGFAALILISLFSLGTGFKKIPNPQIGVMVLCVAGAFLVLLTLLVNNRMKDWAGGLLRVVGLARFQARLQGLVDAIHRYRGHRLVLLQACLLSVILQGLIIVTYAVVGWSMRIDIPLIYFFIFVPLVTVVSMLPVSLAGLGVRESGVVYFFSLVGVDAATSLSMSLVWFSLTVLVSSLGGPAFLLNQHHAKRDEE